MIRLRAHAVFNDRAQECVTRRCTKCKISQFPIHVVAPSQKPIEGQFLEWKYTLVVEQVGQRT